MCIHLHQSVSVTSYFLNFMKYLFHSRWTKSLLGLLALGLALPMQAAQPKKVLVVTVTKGFRHSSIPTAEKVLAKLAQETGAFTVDYVRNDEDMAKKMTAEALQQYDGFIFANTTGILPLPDKDAFLDAIRSGKAFIGMHSASDTFHGPNDTIDPYIAMLGGEFRTHHAQATVECLNQDLDHPATRHFGKSYTVHDEIYLLKNYERNKVHELLILDKHPNEKTPGHFPISWCRQYGQGKVFYTSLGHREDVWEAEPYQKHILGGIKWALGLVPGDATPQATEAGAGQDGFVPLFNGENLDGWTLRRADGPASWTVQNGTLVNDASHGHGTDLVSTRQFRDFTIRYEYKIPKGANSGLYLRGRHEIQILDDFDRGQPSPGGNGAIYNQQPVSKFASKPAGQWNTVEATIQGDKITVELNGVKVHDQVVSNRPTGGEIDGNMAAPGPIMLQGDHGSIAFRNIRIKSLN